MSCIDLVVDDLDHPRAAPGGAAQGAAWKALAGAVVGAPVVVALLGAFVGAVQDCSTDGYRTVALLALTGAAAAAWWARRVRAQAWLIVLSALCAAALAGTSGMVAWLAVNFSRCFTF